MIAIPFFMIRLSIHGRLTIIFTRRHYLASFHINAAGWQRVFSTVTHHDSYQWSSFVDECLLNGSGDVLEFIHTLVWSLALARRTIMGWLTNVALVGRIADEALQHSLLTADDGIDLGVRCSVTWTEHCCYEWSGWWTRRSVTGVCMHVSCNTSFRELWELFMARPLHAVACCEFIAWVGGWREAWRESIHKMWHTNKSRDVVEMWQREILIWQSQVHKDSFFQFWCLIL